MDYQQGKIYKIVCNTTGLQYIGSTCSTLERRLNKHQGYLNEAKKGQGRHQGISSLIVLEGGNYEIKLIENFPCNTKVELLWRERYWIDSQECVNQLPPIVSYEEVKLKWKDYAEKNTDKIKEYKAQWHKDHYIPSERVLLTEEEKKERKQKWTENNKDYYEKYRQEHKEKQKELVKDHYEKHKEDYKERAKAQREKIRNDPELLEKQREYKRLKAREYYAKKKELKQMGVK